MILCDFNWKLPKSALNIANPNATVDQQGRTQLHLFSSDPDCLDVVEKLLKNVFFFFFFFFFFSKFELIIL